MTIGPHILSAVPLIMQPSGEATPKRWSDNFYDELDAEFAGFEGCNLVAQHKFTAPWPTWEMHPKGDELVYLIAGDTDFVLWIDGAEQVIRVNQPGSYVVVPRGVWHTARPHMETHMLFITPGEGTLNEVVPG